MSNLRFSVDNQGVGKFIEQQKVSPRHITMFRCQPFLVLSTALGMLTCLGSGTLGSTVPLVNRLSMFSAVGQTVTSTAALRRIR